MSKRPLREAKIRVTVEGETVGTVPPLSQTNNVNRKRANTVPVSPPLESHWDHPAVGYILLEEEPIHVAGECRAIRHLLERQATWENVRLINSSTQAQIPKEDEDNDTVLDKNTRNSVSLELKENQSNQESELRLHLDLESLSNLVVDGKVQQQENAITPNHHGERKSQNPPPERSDLQCLLSLLQQFSDAIVSLESCQVLLHSKDDERIQEVESPGTLLYATVAVAISFPQLFANVVSTEMSGTSPNTTTRRNRPTTNNHNAASPRHVIPPTTTGRRRSVPLLPSNLQVLLSMLRSDWDYLDRLPSSLSHRVRSAPRRRKATGNTPQLEHTRRKRLFPNHISLEELYMGMDGSSNMLGKGNHNDCCDGCPLMRQLPRDILAEKIAPFLPAKSLQAFRCTSVYFHQTLEAVVPGLNLRLYRHQITSLDWMRQRETKAITEAECFGNNNNYHGVPDRDLHRSVTAGQSTLLRTRSGNWQCRVSQITGIEMVDNQTDPVANRTVARGGLLADEPGLGKTITVLSLVLQTMGLTTKETDQNSQSRSGSPSEEDIFRAYWKESVPKDFRREDLLSLTNRLSRKNKSQVYVPFSSVRIGIKDDSYVAQFDHYERDMRDEINASFPEDSVEQREIRDALQQQFNEMIQSYKSKQIHSASRSYAKVTSHPNSAVASLYEAHERRKFLDSLISSHGTLLVVPSVLLDHWRDQIKAHVNFAYMTKKEPLIFEFTASKGADASLQTAIDHVVRDKTHWPCVFLDRAPSKPLPPAKFLASFQIVITSNSRFMYEWKNGSFQDELRRMSEESPGEDNVEFAYFNSLDRSDSACPLLKIHWLRLVVDEGHSMGRTQQNSSVQFASWISAERRWCMTGTPTKLNGASAINEVLSLMRFLQHDFFTSRCEGDTHWKKYVVKLWKEGNLSGFHRLRSLLRVLMKRHTKLDIVELPAPLFGCKSVPMTPAEVETYNCIVTAVHSNLVLTSLKEDAKQDSLLHVSNRRFAGEALANMRRVCVGFSRVIPTLSDKNWQETLELAKEYKLSEDATTAVKEFVYRAENGKQSDCQCCGLSLSVLLITPCCASLICTDCVNHDVRKEHGTEVLDCMFCSKLFLVDRFQRFQPGFKFDWLDNLKNDAMAKGGAVSPSPRAPPPTNSPTLGPVPPQAVVGPLIRPPQERQRTNKPGDGHECIYDQYSVDGKCTLCFVEHDGCNLLHTGRCRICHRGTVDCPEEESKSSYLVTRLLQLAKRQQSASARPLKVIVFSQYRKALNLVGDRLLGRFGNGCVSEYWGKYRTQELRKFRHSNECFCMLLGNDGSEGLDLSFVTHIFFLEEIWDRARADQAVARAWRMGATGRVEVETIVAQNTVEETMQEYEAQQHRTDKSAAEISSSKEYQVAKTHALLKSLQYITEFQSFRKTSSRASPLNEPPFRLADINENWKRSIPNMNDDYKERTNKKRRVAFCN